MSFSTQPRLTLTCAGCAVAGGEQTPVRLAASAPYTFTYSNGQIVTTDSQSPGMELTLDAPVGSVPMEGNILLDQVEFTDADDNGRPISSIVSGELDYIGLSRPPRPLGREEFVVARSLENFYLTRVGVDAEGLIIELHGQAGQLDVGRAGGVRSELPSRLEQTMSQSPLMVYAGAAVAAGMLAAGLFGFSKRRSRV